MADREKMAYLEDRLTNLGIRFEWLEMQMPLMQKKIEMLEARLTDEIQTSSNEDSNEPNCSEKPNNCETCGTPKHLCQYCIEEDRMWTPKTEPQTDCDGCIYANGDSMFACVSCKGKVPYDGYEWDEPQTDCAWGKGE